MGCNNAKGSGAANPDEIKFEMKPTKVAELDDFFSSASEMLQSLENLRGTFQDQRDEMNEIGRTDELVTADLTEAIKVFLWSVSAHKEGNIKGATPKFTSDPPAFSIDCAHMDHKTYDFSHAMHELIGGMTGAPGEIKTIGEKSKEIGEKANELKSGVADKIKASGLNPMEQVKAGASAASNFATVLKGVAKTPEVLKHAQNTLNDLKTALPKIPGLIADADTVGKEAAKNHHKKIDEIFDHYQKAPKKTPEQIKEEHKGKKPKAHKKKAKKPEVGKPGEHAKAEHKTEGKAEHKTEDKAGEHKVEHA